MNTIARSSCAGSFGRAADPRHLKYDRVVCAENLAFMRGLLDSCCDLIYADPPFDLANRDRFSSSTFTAPAEQDVGCLKGFLEFIRPRLVEMHRLLSDRGSLYVHLDSRTVHYVKVMLDDLFGGDSFLNEIIWSYRTGGRPASWFCRKHDTLLLYVKSPGEHTFHRLRHGAYRTRGLRKDSDGRLYKSTRNGRIHFHPDGPAVTDVWDIPFLSTVSKERTGYPSQKPEALLERIVRASSNEGDVVADFACGSGTALAVAKRLNRHWIGCDVNPDALVIAQRRLGQVSRSAK